MVMAGMMVAQKLRRNTKITITTSAIVSIKVNCTSVTDARMVWVRSETTLSLIDGGIEASSCGKQRLDAIDRLDDIGAGLALDGENDGALLVVPAGDQVVFRPLDGPADVADAHRRTVAVGDDQVVVGLGLQQLIVGVEREALLRTVERSLGEIDIGLAEHVAHVFEADAAIGERLRIDLDADRGLLLSADADLADAVDLRDFRNEDVFGDRRRPWSAAAYPR